jgi:hypothetical protein
METFGTINPIDHTIDKYGAFANIQWEIVSSSDGTSIVFPQKIEELSGSIVINRASNQSRTALNDDTGIYEHVLYASVKHNFYDETQFTISGSVVSTSRLYTVPDNIFVLSIGQNLYGEKITPATFRLSIHPNSGSIYDDGDGNLFVTQSNGIHLIGNIFYAQGIAVFTHDTESSTTSLTSAGVKLVGNSKVFLQYDSSMTYEQHQINIVLKPEDFTLSIFNPSILRLQNINGDATQSFADLGITAQNDNQWAISSLMKTGVIKPYVTTIGLYNEQYELLAVAKLSTPIQRTFDTTKYLLFGLTPNNNGELYELRRKIQRRKRKYLRRPR